MAGRCCPSTASIASKSQPGRMPAGAPDRGSGWADGMATGTSRQPAARMASSAFG